MKLARQETKRNPEKVETWLNNVADWLTVRLRSQIIKHFGEVIIGASHPIVFVACWHNQRNMNIGYLNQNGMRC